MNAADNSKKKFLICLVVTGFLHLLILWGVSFPTTTVSDNSFEPKIKWAPHKMKEKRKQLAESPIGTKSAQKNNTDIIEDIQNASKNAQLRKTNKSLEGEDLAKRVAKIFQHSSQEREAQNVNHQRSSAVKSYLSSWDRKCERLGRSNFGLIISACLFI